MSWAAEEFETLDLGDARLNLRAVLLAVLKRPLVDHQRVPRQGRAPLIAQRRQSFLARRQMIAVKDAQEPPREARLSLQLCHHRRQTGGAAPARAARPAPCD